MNFPSHPSSSDIDTKMKIKMNTNTNNNYQKNSQTVINKENNNNNKNIHDKNLNNLNINKIVQTVLQAAKASNELPSNEQFKIYETLYPNFREKMKADSEIILDLISKLQKQQLSIENNNSIENFMDVVECDDVSEKFDTTIDLLDHFLEDVDNALEEITILNKSNQNDSSSLSSSSSPSNKNNNDESEETKKFFRPQLIWKDDIDNSNNVFQPKISFKLNSIENLKDSLHPKNGQRTINADNSFPYHRLESSGMGGPIKPNSYPHPYSYEIINLNFNDLVKNSNKNNNKMFGFKKNIQKFSQLSKTPCEWINTVKELKKLSIILTKQTEFAIDLENHSYRTFQGFVCLMQISTRKKDYLIDTLELRKDLQILNSSFTNPNIVKIMHGSDCDILWLQRDFGIYVVNLFDTGQASRVLRFPTYSYAFLLSKYCQICPDKKYQLADWRIRPLPFEMIKYARQDTHYLLYIYDKMKNELIQRQEVQKSHNFQNNVNNNLLKMVFERSKNICLRRYEKELFSEETMLVKLQKLLIHHKTQFNETQIIAFKALFFWRDYTARCQDESLKYVLPLTILFFIARDLPKNIIQLKNCFPSENFPKMVIKDSKLILMLLERAEQEKIVDQELIKNRTLIKRDQKTGEIVKSEKIVKLEDRDLFLSPPQQKKKKNNKIPTSPILSSEELYKMAGWTINNQTLDTQNIIFNPNINQNLGPGGSHNYNVELKRSENSNIFSNSFQPVNYQSPKTKKVFESFSELSSNGNSNNNDYLLTEFTRFMQLQQQQKSKPQNTLFRSLTEDNTNTSIDDNITFQTPEKSNRKNFDFNNNNNNNNDDNYDITINDIEMSPTDEDVPTSLNQIYKLSKKNRKRNKQKKKLKEASVTDPSPAYSPTSLNISTSSNDDDNVKVFLKKLGWN